jgi:dihydroxyacetone kinase-like protein
VITQERLDSATIISWLKQVAVVMRAQRDYLVQLDAAIGDGDHGINMSRGFDAVVEAIAVDDTLAPGRLLILTGRTLVSRVGGASGPLWGSAFRAAGRALGDMPSFDAAALATSLEAAVTAVAVLGAASVGDKTMVDALQPALTALRERLDQGAALHAALEAAADAADAGVRSTVPLQARRGRASYLGVRSVGHQDPGATSAALILRELERAVAGAGGAAGS